MRFLVTGGTGFVGSHVVDALLARGDEVTALARDPKKLRWLTDREVRVVKGDVASGEGLPAGLDGADGVLHVAGAIQPGPDDAFTSANIRGTRNVLEACAASKKEHSRVVVVTSLAAVGPPADGVASREGDECRPVSAYGRSKAEAEKVCAEFQGKLPVVIVRPPVVYGPRDEAVLDILKVVNWRLKPLVAPDQRLSIVHVRDLSRGILAAAEKGKAGEAYFLAHPDVMTSREFLNRIEEALGVIAMTLAIPQPLFRAVAAISGALSGGTAILGPDKAREILAPAWVCDSSKAREQLGWTASIPHADGLSETAGWYRENRWL